jgi:hypothetical protein
MLTTWVVSDVTPAEEEIEAAPPSVVDEAPVD